MIDSAEIIGVGTELLLGNTVNTDARDISEGLSALGINVYYHTVVGDNPERLKQAVEIARSRAGIIITTGGLGPTYDDLTKQTLADAFGKKLIYHEELGRDIRDYFARRHRSMTENNLRQAMLPEGCVIFRNDHGTAPGCAFTAKGVHVLMLPGPPNECRAMFEQCAVPYLKRLSDAEIVSHSIHIFGMGESAVEELLHDQMERLTNPTLAPYAKAGEVMLRLTAKSKSRAEAEALMAPVLAQVQDALGDVIYGMDTQSLEATVLPLLEERSLTLATAESCTGGLLSKRLTDLPGASRVFLGGVAAYANHAKTALLDVPAEMIEAHGAVSEPVARAMAMGVRKRLDADLGVAITGIAGPGSDGTEKEPGTVFIALSAKDGSFCKALELRYERSQVRLMSASHALDLIRRYVTGLPL